MTPPLPVGLVVVSDRAAAGTYEDRCAPALRDYLTARGASLVRTVVVPDGIEPVREAVAAMLAEGACHLILTAGGTGVSPRDLTPEGVAPLIDRPVPGIAEAMRAASLAVTPHAVLSRSVAGLAGNVFVVTLPGSPKGGVENLDAVFTAIRHGVGKARGDATDCAPASSFPRLRPPAGGIRQPGG